jgi:ABC-type polysaccharide/polyol phosphate transport system ATPase subunit
MEVGEISVDGVSRRFRIHAREARTLKDLVVQRGHSSATDVWALRDVSTEIGKGEAVGLIGRNGSGKTTLLRVVAGIIKPTAGRVRSEGRIGSPTSRRGSTRSSPSPSSRTRSTGRCARTRPG